MTYLVRGAWVTSLLVSVSATVVSGEPPSKQAIPPPLESVFLLNDGSRIKMAILQENVEVVTKYGKLTVPFADIRRIEVGVRVPPEVEAAIQRLGSPEHRQREAASKQLLTAGSLAYPALKKTPHDDTEVAQRVKQLIERITERYPPELLQRREEDVIYAEFTVIGRVTASSIKAQSLIFGPVDVPLAQLRTLHACAAHGERDLTVDAAKHGSSLDAWLDSGFMVDPTQRLLITSEGQVDLWPQGPGQYLVRPKGYSSAGLGGKYMAGALLGKIGKTGNVFVIGERYSGTPDAEGTLHLHIVPSAWNNASLGSYTVRVRTDFAIPPAP